MDMDEIIIQDSQDGLFPEFLLKPLFNDFDDDYELFKEDTVVAFPEVAKIGRKYRDINRWREAREIYDEYMEILASKYHGKDFLKAAIKADSIPEYVPPKPTLKGAYNKKLAKLGYSISRVRSKEPLRQMAQELRQIGMPDLEIHDNDPSRGFIEPIPENIEKLLRSGYQETEREARLKSMYNKNGIATSRDFVIEYYTDRLLNGRYDENGRYRDLGIVDMMEEQERDRYFQEYDTDEPKMVYQGGRYYSTDEENFRNIIRALNNLGVNVVKTFSGDMSKKKEVKMIKKKMGIGYDMSKKERKNWKKKAKKEARRRMEMNDKLSRILTGNQIDFNDDALEFTIRDMDKAPF